MFEWLFATNGCLSTNGCLCLLWTCYLYDSCRYDTIVERVNRLELNLRNIDTNRYR